MSAFVIGKPKIINDALADKLAELHLPCRKIESELDAKLAEVEKDRDSAIAVAAHQTRVAAEHARHQKEGKR